MRLQIECQNCGKTLFLEKNDIKIGILTKKGTEVSKDDYSRTQKVNNLRINKVRHIKQTYSLTKDVKEQYFTCFVCGEISWLNHIWNDDLIEKGKGTLVGEDWNYWYHKFPCKCDNCKKYGWTHE